MTCLSVQTRAAAAASLHDTLVERMHVKAATKASFCIVWGWIQAKTRTAAKVWLWNSPSLLKALIESRNLFVQRGVKLLRNCYNCCTESLDGFATLSVNLSALSALEEWDCCQAPKSMLLCSNVMNSLCSGGNTPPWAGAGPRGVSAVESLWDQASQSAAGCMFAVERQMCDSLIFKVEQIYTGQNYKQQACSSAFETLSTCFHIETLFFIANIKK